MQNIPLPRLRAEAKRQLYNKRRNTMRAYKSPAQRAQICASQDWSGAIDAARAYFRANDPLKEQFMVRLFGLETAIPRNQLTRVRMVQLQAELCVTESTLYKWREDIFEIVLYAAIERGLIHPFGLTREEGEAAGTSVERD